MKIMKLFQANVKEEIINIFNSSHNSLFETDVAAVTMFLAVGRTANVFLCLKLKCPLMSPSLDKNIKIWKKYFFGMLFYVTLFSLSSSSSGSSNDFQGYQGWHEGSNNLLGAGR